MERNVIGLFDSLTDAQAAIKDLVEAGFHRDQISLVANDASSEYSTYLGKGTGSTTDAVTGSEGASFGAVVGGLTGVLVSLGALAIPGIGPVIAAGPLLAALGGGAVGALAGAATGGITASLIKTGLPEEEAQLYTEGIRRGGTLLVAYTNDDVLAQRGAAIMDSHGAVDVDQRGEEWRSSGWKYDANAKPYTTDQIRSFRSTTQQTSNRPNQPQTDREGKTVLPVVEENLQVEKREVERGGVRVNTRVIERPVEEKVTLHEEHVNVERRPVDRPVTQNDMAAFKESSIEMRERTEEPVVSKQARVIEEIVISKEATERTETVRDTVRKTEVDLQDLSANQNQSTTTRGFDAYDFRKHYTTNYTQSGYSYDQYMPAYRYGYTLANDPNYSGDWITIEPEVQRNWEARNKGTWQDFKDAIRYAWDQVRGRPASTTR